MLLRRVISSFFRNACKISEPYPENLRKGGWVVLYTYTSVKLVLILLYSTCIQIEYELRWYCMYNLKKIQSNFLTVLYGRNDDFVKNYGRFRLPLLTNFSMGISLCLHTVKKKYKNRLVFLPSFARKQNVSII